MMSKKYPGGHYDKDNNYVPSLADAMTRFMWGFLEQQGQGLVFTDFCDKIEAWINGDEKQLYEFYFVCLDTLYQGKITEEGLFKFMNIVSRKMSREVNNTKLLKLNEVEKDLFLSLFSEDFVKISEQLH